jgi:hypothetical protein
MTVLGTVHGALGRPPHPPRVVVAHGTPRVLEGRGRTAATSAVPRLRRHPLLPRPSSRLFSCAPGRRWPRPPGRPSAAPALPPRAPPGDRPPTLGRRHQGLPSCASLAQQAAAVFQRSRALRRRVVSSRRRGRSAWSGAKRPGSGKAPFSWAAGARCHRPRRAAGLPPCRAASAPLSPGGRPHASPLRHRAGVSRPLSDPTWAYRSTHFAGAVSSRPQHCGCATRYSALTRSCMCCSATAYTS